MSAPDSPVRDPWLACDVRHLTALVTVARLRSFSGAAAALGYGPSAVSSQIAHLEGVAGCRLFERPGGRGESAPTPAGAALVEHAEAILGTLVRARAEVGELAAEPPAALAAGRTPALADRLAGAFASGVDVRVEPAAIDAAPALLDRLRAGTLDAAFVDLPVARGPFSSAEILREPRALAVPACVSVHDAHAAVRALGLVRLRDCPGSEALGSGAAAEHVVDTPAAALALVRAGNAAAVVAHGDVPSGTDGVRLLPAVLPPRVIGLVWHRNRDGDPGLARVLAHARRTLM